MQQPAHARATTDSAKVLLQNLQPNTPTFAALDVGNSAFKRNPLKPERAYNVFQLPSVLPSPA